MNSLPSLPPLELFDVVIPFDEALGVYCVFASVARPEVVVFKVLVESYEGIGAARSLDPHHEPGRALVCFLAVPDFIDQTVAMFESLEGDYDLRVIEGTEAMLSKARSDLRIDPV
ncbi:MAG: hypothetical protein ACI8TX_002718 [Hyphomicrobiaceae bacterium]